MNCTMMQGSTNIKICEFCLHYFDSGYEQLEVPTNTPTDYLASLKTEFFAFDFRNVKEKVEDFLCHIMGQNLHKNRS